MRYHVARNGQIYGPYTLDDLHRYIASGHILPTDSAKSDEMTDWVPIPQILANAPEDASSTASPFSAAAAQPAYGIPATGYAPAVGFEDPPNLNWALLLLFGLLTCGVFTVVYDLIQAFWWKRIQPATRVVTFYLICYACYFVNVLLSAGNVAGMRHGHRPNLLASLFSIAGFVLLLVARFTFRGELERHYNTVEPVGLTLGGIMTFFFGGLYFQYHFNRINTIKQAARYTAGAIPR
jgi:hypothetical protein